MTNSLRTRTIQAIASIILALAIPTTQLAEHTPGSPVVAAAVLPATPPAPLWSAGSIRTGGNRRPC